MLKVPPGLMIVQIRWSCFSFTYNNADDSTETEHALGVSVGAGDIRVGEVYVISNNDNANYEEYPRILKNRLSHYLTASGTGLPVTAESITT